MSHAVLRPAESEPSLADPLLGCLLVLAHRHRRLVDEAVLTRDLPLDPDGRLTAEALPKAAARAGFTARLEDRPLDGLAAADFPAIVLLADNDACLVVGRRADGSFEVLLPDAAVPALVPGHTLAARFIGQVLLLRPREPTTDDEAQSPATPRLSRWRAALPFAFAAMPGDAAALALAALLPRIATHWGTLPRTVTAAVAAAVVIEAGFRLLHRLLMADAQRPAGEALSRRLFRQLFSQERQSSPGAFAEALRSFEGERAELGGKAMGALSQLPFMLVIAAAIAWLGGRLVLLPLAAGAIAAIAALLLHPVSERTARQAIREASRRQGLLVETLSGVETLRALGAEARAGMAWARRSAQTAAARLAGKRLEILTAGIPTLLQAGVLLATTAWGASLVADGAMSAPTLAVCLLLVARLLAWIDQATPLLARAGTARSALDELRAEVPTPEPRAEPRLGEARFDHLTLRDLAFAPPDRPALFDGVSLDLAAGQSLALCGPPGRGKTTLLRLILGLVRPTGGELRLAASGRHGLFGYVPQETMLFSGSLRDNLTLARPAASDEAIWRAVALAGLDGLVTRLGLDAQVGERGSLLSAGERQGVALARALLGDPPLLLLDDPCSSWSDDALEALAKRLAPALVGRSLILISGRQPLLALAERRLVL